MNRLAGACRDDLDVQTRRRARPARAPRPRASASSRAAAPSAARPGCPCRRRRRPRRRGGRRGAAGCRRSRRRRCWRAGSGRPSRRPARGTRPLGSIACWISRAISRSFLSDSRSATSSSTSRFISSERDEQRPGSVAERRQRNEEEQPDAERAVEREGIEAEEQVDQADDGRDDRRAVDDAARRRELHREGEEHQADAPRDPPVPGQRPRPR